jgi:putative radical SAM enzyme (TIGR03279 family)
MSMTVIKAVDLRSPAHRAGVRVGETLVEINGHPIVDVLDYKFYSYDARLELKLARPDGAVHTLRLRKAEGEDLGLEFETYLMDRARSCANHCIFCFVDQMPPGMRKSLYFKDDDARLSFLMGNYLTLTNLSPREVQRIIDLRISPINVSVHTTDPKLRGEMLKNPRAGEAIAIMERFARNHITMNCQIVSCPGINDGPQLDKTLEDLAGMYPSVNSISVVPVGVTRYRQGLYPLEPYTQAQAAALVDQVEAFAQRHWEEKGTRLVWCSDEFYLLAGRELPQEDYFEEFTQLDNGVGMLRLLMSEFSRALDLAQPEELEAIAPFSIATGVSAAPFLRKIIDMLREKCGKIEGEVYPIRNFFFGETITVAGLVTGGDLMEQMKGRKLGQRLLIPTNMLRAGERVFLDDVTLDDVEQALGVPVIAVAQDGYELLDALCGLAPATPDPGPKAPEEEYYRYNPGVRG